MNRLVADVYKSPSRLGVVAKLENKFLSADDSWWTVRVMLPPDADRHCCPSLPGPDSEKSREGGESPNEALFGQLPAKATAILRS